MLLGSRTCAGAAPKALMSLASWIGAQREKVPGRSGAACGGVAEATTPWVLRNYLLRLTEGWVSYTRVLSLGSQEWRASSEQPEQTRSLDLDARGPTQGRSQHVFDQNVGGSRTTRA